MQKSKIEWTDYTLNPIKGLCPVDCKDNQGKEYCYARRLYKRFHWNPEIRYTPIVFRDIQNIKEPSRVFIGSTMELFGDWIEDFWLRDIFNIITTFWKLKKHTFIFLTKKPEELLKWSPFPPNCQVGVSCTDEPMFDEAIKCLIDIEAKVKFISFEPLLGRIRFPFPELDLAGINWVIIGSRTQPVKHPPKEWVDGIVDSADKAGIPVFVKEPMASHFGIYRKEYPR